MWAKLTAAACFAKATAASVQLEHAALEADDECLSQTGELQEHCSLNALQLRGTAAEPVATAVTLPAEVPQNESDPIADARDDDTPPDWMDAVYDLKDLPTWEEVDDADQDPGAASLNANYISGWYIGGDKFWGHGTGIENVNVGNVHYYDSGMQAARGRCGGPGCALLINPPGHRTVNVVHIHSIHFASYGRSLKTRLETKTCHQPGVWAHGNLPCHGKAAFFHGNPGVFSKALASGDIHRATVIAWPQACGGVGTIVEIGYGCSIEHQIRGDYNPKYR